MTTFAEKLKGLLEKASAGPTRRTIQWPDGTDAWVQDDPAEKLVDALVSAAPALVRLLEHLNAEPVSLRQVFYALDELDKEVER